jgi:hypothetical protein
MITETQINNICRELESPLPLVARTAAKELGWLGASDTSGLYAGQQLPLPWDQRWNCRFTFLLLVLAAEGVPYDC